MRKFAILGLAAILLTGLCSQSFAEEEKIHKVGDAVPSFKLTNVEGSSVDVNLKEGKPTALVFFNSACSACRAEMTLLNKLRSKNKELKVVAVCTDVSGAAGVERFTKMTKFTDFDYYLDSEMTSAQKFGVNATPSIILLDDSGKIFYAKNGYMSRDEKVLIDKITK